MFDSTDNVIAPVQERPILFSAPMVRAILNGGKTQTRRVVKPQPVESPTNPLYVEWKDGTFSPDGALAALCPYGKPGDRLWVKETWRPELESLVGESANGGLEVGIEYAADGECLVINNVPGEWCQKHSDDGEFVSAHWRPSIFMPRWASRILLEVTGVRVERLQDITEEEAEREGVYCVDPGNGDASRCWVPGFHTNKDEFAFARDAFAGLWNSINGPGSWKADPWVWVIEFERLEAQEQSVETKGEKR